MLAGEPDPRVQVHAGIPTGIPTGNLYLPAPVSSLNLMSLPELEQKHLSDLELELWIPAIT